MSCTPQPHNPTTGAVASLVVLEKGHISGSCHESACSPVTVPTELHRLQIIDVRETIVVCSQIHTELINTVCVGRTQNYRVTYSHCCSLCTAECATGSFRALLCVCASHITMNIGYVLMTASHSHCQSHPLLLIQN